MPRAPDVWLRKQTGWYCTKVGGTVHRLSKDKAEARKAFYKLMGRDEKPRGRCRVSTRKLCDLYLTRTEADKAPGTHVSQVWHLKAFCERFGGRDPSTLKVHEVADWLDGRATWGKSTKALAVTVIKAAMNWGAAQGHLDVSPVKGLKRRKTEHRDRVLTPAEREQIRAAVSPAFADFLAVLEQTGCRPFSEAAHLTAAMIDWANGRAVLARHKNAGKGKGRVIYFPPAMLARLKELAADHPTGPLLRNRLGRAWVTENAGHYLRRTYRRLGVEPFTAYAYRHTYITEALVKGVPIEAVAELVGNSPRVIHATYAHLCKVPDAMRAAALKAVS